MTDHTQKDPLKAAKAMARHLAAALKQSGHDMAHGQLLEIVAKGFGARNWHAFQDDMAKAAANAGPAAVPAPLNKDEPWNPLHGFATQEQFRARGEDSCPVCGCTDIDGGSIDVEDKTCSQPISCLDCEASWTTHYQLTGYTLDDEARAQADAHFVEAVRAALEQQLGDEDAQMELDDLIVDWFVARGLPELNATPGAAAQEQVIASAEQAASSLNNQGMTAQLDFLWAELKTRKALLQLLSDKLGLDATAISLTA